MAKYKGPVVKIKDFASDGVFDLPATTLAIAHPWGIHSKSFRVSIDQITGKVHFLNKKGKPVFAASCSWPLNEWETGECCFVKGDPGQRDTDGRQVFWLSLIVANDTL